MAGSGLEGLTRFERALVLVPVATGSISFFSSSAMIVLLLRDPRIRQSNPIKRHLLMSICVADLFISASYACSTFLAPRGEKSWDDLAISYRGTAATCRLQAAFAQIGLAQPSYNAALCIYHLLIIRYNKTDTTMSKWFLPLVHFLIFCYAPVGAIVGLWSDSFHSAGSLGCYFSPPENASKETLNHERLILFFAVIPISIDFAVILGGMIAIYVSLRRVERRAKKWNFEAATRRHSMDFSQHNRDLIIAREDLELNCNDEPSHSDTKTSSSTAVLSANRSLSISTPSTDPNSQGPERTKRRRQELSKGARDIGLLYGKSRSNCWIVQLQITPLILH